MPFPLAGFVGPLQFAVYRCTLQTRAENSPLLLSHDLALPDTLPARQVTKPCHVLASGNGGGSAESAQRGAAGVHM